MEFEHGVLASGLRICLSEMRTGFDQRMQNGAPSYTTEKCFGHSCLLLLTTLM